MVRYQSGNRFESGRASYGKCGADLRVVLCGCWIYEYFRCRDLSDSGKILLMLYEKLCVLAGAVPFCTWIGGAPEIWQCVVYYVLLFGGIQIALFLKEKERTVCGESCREEFVLLLSV